MSHDTKWAEEEVRNAQEAFEKRRLGGLTVKEIPGVKPYPQSKPLIEGSMLAFPIYNSLSGQLAYTNYYIGLGGAWHRLETVLPLAAHFRI